jgi:tRNA threonylcarbamoyl adenosine modification protein YeaZ
LSLETSSVICGASLHDNEECLAETYLKEPRVHAEKLVTLVEKLFEDQMIRVPSLSAVVVSAGPGSFTGLRIGMSFAKGLAFPHQIPLAGVNTMKAFMHGTLHAAERKDHPLWVIRSHKDYIYMAELNNDIEEIDIRYGRIADITDRYPHCSQIISNEALPELAAIRVVEKDILPSMIGEYYLRYHNGSAVNDHDSLVLEYGMDYKPKEWKTGP